MINVRFSQAIDLSIDESSFTGENEPAAKKSGPYMPAGGNGESVRNVAFMGTLVRCGSGKVSSKNYLFKCR